MHTNLTQKLIIPLFLILCLLLASCKESRAPVYQGSDVKLISPQKYTDLEQTFERYDYQLYPLDNGVPPLVLKAMPGDISTIGSNKAKKELFFRALLPMVLLANDEIRFERSQLNGLYEVISNNQQLTSSQKLILNKLAQRYRLQNKQKHPEQTAKLLKQLKLRIDTIPADLALAQAANESAWGTSRFALLANNLFGEWTFIPGQGIVPKGRPAGETYEVRKFDTVYDSVRSYLNNLNCHKAYTSLRKLRQEMRQNNVAPNGIELAQGLLLYSTRGQAYVDELRAMIKKNQLQLLTAAELRTSS